MFNPYQTQLDDLSRQIADNQALLNDPELGELAQAEITALQTQQQELQTLADDFAASNGEENTNSNEPLQLVNCLLEIRAGAGGDEASIWGNDLARMYLRFAERIGLKFEYLDDDVIKFKGRTSYFVDLPAPTLPEGMTYTPPQTAYDIFMLESGVHRVQRVPETEAQGRVHTSTASVAVLPEVTARAITIRGEDLDWQFVRAGGAGGQNVNKVNSAVRLTHVPSGVMVTARRERTQAANREIAMNLLRSQLWEIEEEKRLKDLGQARLVIGRAQRAEKIRTYNYPQNRVTDHRINESWYALDRIMEGDLTDVLPLLQQLKLA